MRKYQIFGIINCIMLSTFKLWPWYSTYLYW